MKTPFSRQWLRTRLQHTAITFMNLNERVLTSKLALNLWPAPGFEFSPVDRLRWWIDGWLSRLFALAYEGSDEELEAVYGSEIPVAYMSARQRSVLDQIPADQLSAHCCHCFWKGPFACATDGLCPECAEPIYVDPFLPIECTR